MRIYLISLKTVKMTNFYVSCILPQSKKLKKKKNYYVERQGTLYTYSSFMEIFKKQRSSIQKIYVTTQGYTTASFTSKFS